MRYIIYALIIWSIIGLNMQTTCCQPSEAVLTKPAADRIARHDLVFEKPIPRWDEALPLGNGMCGILVWGDGHPLKLSLDRADLWDTRPVAEWDSPDYNYQTMREWVAAGRIQDLHRLYDEPYDRNAAPTKIPSGRIEIAFPENVQVASSRLALVPASAHVTLTNGAQIEIWQHATEPIGYLMMRGQAGPFDLKLVAPTFGGKLDSTQIFNSLKTGSLARLGYPAPQYSRAENSEAFEQIGWGDFRFAVAVTWKQTDREWWEIAWSIASSKESATPRALAQKRAAAALKAGFDAMRRPLLAWWRNFWNQSHIEIPNPILERQWYLDLYKFGAVARRGAPPISLQAVWTADEGQLPPWKGDYHHDLNTQLSYWPGYTSNHLSEGLSYLDWLWEIRGEARKFTQKFFGKPGLCIPMTSDIEGKQMGGWHQYTHSATTAAWLAQHFYLHWRYSQDREFLRDRAYPFLTEVAVFLEAITEKNSQGQRCLPLSSSPEIFDNRLEAWLPPTSNYDLALLRWLFAATAEFAGILGETSAQTHWQQILAEFPPFALAADDGRLLVAPNLALTESHRHFSHLMAIHPLGLFRWESGPEHQQVMRQALNELDRLGTHYWTGYSFAWLASHAARCKDGARAEQALEIFSQAFCSPNSFHLNGDQSGKGYSRFTYRPFTLEGNMAAAAGLQEMLLQSYGGIIRIFPAIPANWQTVRYSQLRAEGAFLVSAERQAGKLVAIQILAEKGGLLELENPFPEPTFQLETDSVQPIDRTGPILKFSCQPGGRLLLKATN
ncbi:glycoside hydrolase family 95 protein [candidate division KSB1 bacterium]|nr:glycoside hydrolase family 95 protein [candidate division KSB1 bacterium]